ncbi:MAG: IS1634 family transposase, partial [Candidatus Ratteibacteria bacterium]
MAYLIEQKIGKNIYVYEAESRWDKEKKQPRQKRNYLGRKDLTTGEVAKVRGSFKPRYARDWGNAYLLFKIAEGIRLIP